MMRRTASRGRASDGQIIVIFALGLVAMIAMVGLVLDGGSTFAQRRGQQNAADLAAMAGANQYLLTGDETLAPTTARERRRRERLHARSGRRQDRGRGGHPE